MSPDLPLSPASLVRDPARLAVLDAYGILDTPPEEGFDDLVHLAALACGTPVALVSLVTDQRQWFKARVNFPPCETDLERSVCRFVLAEPDLLVIPDLAADPRTASNPLVTGEPRIRFYAGAPLRTPEGQVLGSLCVIDHQPRPGGLSEVQADHLRRCARQAMKLLEMRRAVLDRDAVLARQDAELRRERHLAILAEASAALLTAADPARVIEPILATGAASLGFEQCFIHDIAPDGLHLRLRQSIGAADAVRAALLHVGFEGPLCGIVAQTRAPLVLEGVLDSLKARYALARSSGIDAFAGYPILSRGQLVGIISFCTAAQPAFDEGALAFFATIARYLSAVRERLDGEAALLASEAHWRGLFERLSEGFIVGEVIRDAAGMVRDWRYVDVNAAWGDLTGIPSESVAGRTIREALPGIEEAWINDFAEVVDTGRSIAFTRQFGSNGRTYEGRGFKLEGDRFGVLFLEVTERVRAEARREALLGLGDRLRDLGDAGDMVMAASETLGTTLDALLVGYGEVDPGRGTITVERDWTTGGAETLAGTLHFRDYGSYIEDLRRGETVIVTDCRTDARTREHAAALEACSARAFVNAPVFERGAFVALLYVCTAHPRDWDTEELAFIREVGSRLRLAISRMRAEAAQEVLNQEISHRLKNTAAMILSIAGQTLRHIEDRKPVQAFEKRVLALSAAHDVLLRKNWMGASVYDVVQAAVAGSGHADRYDVSGPEVELGPRSTLSLAMLLHELATNAAKYGSLSVPGGRIIIGWRCEDQEDDAQVVLDWTETGGPEPALPTTSGRKGFGSRLIQMGLVGTGGVELRYLPQGFQASMRASLAQLRRS